MFLRIKFQQKVFTQTGCFQKYGLPVKKKNRHGNHKADVLMQNHNLEFIIETFFKLRCFAKAAADGDNYNLCRHLISLYILINHKNCFLRNGKLELHFKVWHIIKFDITRDLYTYLLPWHYIMQNNLWIQNKGTDLKPVRK